MPEFRIIPAAEQVVDHLRDLLLRGHWTRTMPGENRLAAELGVSTKIVEIALRQLETENLLVGQGPRRQRLIVPPRGGHSLPTLRVAILLYDIILDAEEDYIGDLKYKLIKAGYRIVFPAKTLIDLKMDLNRIENLVEQTEADVWVVHNGSVEILEWFSARSEPTFALFGRNVGLPMAALVCEKVPASINAFQQLIELGHRRIVMLTRKHIRLPKPGRCAQLFLDEMEAHGIPTGTYNLPDWEESNAGLHKILDALFQVTAPTALIIDEPLFFPAVQQFLISQRIRVPEEVSLICMDSDPSFAWCDPPITHIHTSTIAFSRDVVRWLAAVSKGHNNVRQTHYPAEFVPGGTIGPAPKGLP